MTKPSVAVLGCGPAGLAAAHAATVAGCDVRIFSKKRKSELFGAQYLHRPIPGMTSTAPRRVTVTLWGTHDGYRARVYGAQAAQVPKVSTEDLEESHDAWDIRTTYDNLWDAYKRNITSMPLDGSSMTSLLHDCGFDLLFSTVPAPVLCRTDHTFLSQDVFAIGDAPEREQWLATERAPDVGEGRLVCNGLPLGAASPDWYRVARVFGHTTIEYPLDVDPGLVVQAARVRKPITTNCDCWPEAQRLGRYGEWKKGVLVHHAYEEALEACLAL
jgi:hypothetical protein